jgi:Peptide-N-glycosidase F, C terminal/Peptide-N-glycosidase F, N terminal
MIKILTGTSSATLIVLLFVVAGCGEKVALPPTEVISLFDDVILHFTPDDSTHYDSPFASARDKGRVMVTYREFSGPITAHKATLELSLRPIRKGIREVHDRWDRAGWIRLVKSGTEAVELIRFMTSYGGETRHSADVSRILPLLNGHCEFEVFVDTWVSPAWEVDVNLILEAEAYATSGGPTWTEGLIFPDGGLNAEQPSHTATISIPASTRRTELALISTGHCTDGRDADEFIPKDNVILIDGQEVFRWRPWRDDCGELRALNPYCARWADGSWSSDYSRSGWCPGDIALPTLFDATPWLAPGDHTITWLVENIRPRDADGNHGYWRVSASASGW